MIDQVDATLGELLRVEALTGWDAEIVYDAPDREWAGRRTRPVVDVFLYDIRPDEKRRELDMGEIRNENHNIVGFRRPPQSFRLSYLITTWARRPEDEHRLLGQLVVALLRYDRVPPQYLQGDLAQTEAQIDISLSKLGGDRSVAEIWSVMGGQLHPSLDLSVVVPFDPALSFAAGPPVTEQPDLIARRLRPPTRPPAASHPRRSRSPGAEPGGTVAAARGHVEEPTE